MTDKCHICQSTKITYYRQMRKDGVAVVTARCENDHIPLKGKPFYELPAPPVKKYPPMPRNKSTGVNFLFPVEDK